MIREQIAFSCDVCGRSVAYDKKEFFDAYADVSVLPLPEGWRRIEPYGDTCTKCCEELDGVYKRIHAPMKAREEYAHHEKQR